MLYLVSYASASVPTEVVMPMSERLAYALRMLVVGLGMVFVVLAILWGVLELSRRLLTKSSAPAADKAAPTPAPAADKAAPTPAPAPVAAPKSVPAPACTPCADGALIAVITAAVQAAMEEQGTLPAGGFRVVSFKSASGHRGWNSK